jgi:hypothetical protein
MLRFAFRERDARTGTQGNGEGDKSQNKRHSCEFAGAAFHAV